MVLLSATHSLPVIIIVLVAAFVIFMLFDVYYYSGPNDLGGYPDEDEKPVYTRVTAHDIVMALPDGWRARVETLKKNPIDITMRVTIWDANVYVVYDEMNVGDQDTVDKVLENMIGDIKAGNIVWKN